MKTIRLALLAVAITSTTTAYGGTPQDTYKRLWGKRAIDPTDQTTWLKPKAACVCSDGRMGAFAINPIGGGGYCALPNFDAQGNVNSLGPCFTWEYIGK